MMHVGQLDDEARFDPVKMGVVVHAQPDEMEDLLNMLRRNVGIESDDHIAADGMQDDAVVVHTRSLGLPAARE